MDILYKYSKEINNFIHMPTLKFAIPAYFNDPFESSISRDISELLDKENPEIPEFDFDMEFSSIGVVSFSETSRNLLMWAHYANEHHGMCIGFDRNVLSSLELGHEYLERYHTRDPVKVNYDNLRVNLKELKSNSDFLFEKAITKTLTTKSDEWIYEKEHRCIIPIGWSDMAFLKETNPKVIRAIEKWHSDTTHINDNTGEIITTNKSFVFENLATYRGMLFLKKIHPSSIKTIHLGYRYPNNAAVEMANTLSNPSHPLHHVELFKYKLSKNRFELEEFALHPSNPIYL